MEEAAPQNTVNCWLVRILLECILVQRQSDLKDSFIRTMTLTVIAAVPLSETLWQYTRASVLKYVLVIKVYYRVPTKRIRILTYLWFACQVSFS